jgi:hypothetical protein
VISLARGDQLAAARRTAGELHRQLHGFGARVPEPDDVESGRCAPGQLASQRGTERRDVHLHHVRPVHVECVGKRLPDNRMVVTEAQHAISAQEIQVAVMLVVIDVASLRAGIPPIEADESQRLYERRVEMLFREVELARRCIEERVCDVEGHACHWCRTALSRLTPCSARVA